jgi:methyl-accepting chemotaxis protein
MSSSPEEIQEDIERTREDLRQNVDALQEKVSIKGAASRRADKVKESVSQVKDTIMGTADSGLSSAKEVVSSAGETAGELPTRARRTTQGNPLAVGLGAFAIGWLVGSLIPASQRERQAVEKVNERADLTTPVQNVVSEAQEAGKQALQEVAQEAKAGAQQVKESVQQ